MVAFDVFNGDADGICALHQLRLAEPREAELITGVKREIDLLTRVAELGADKVTALDISFDTNEAAVRRLLEAGTEVFYADHHSADKRFEHPKLRLLWDDARTVCTSLLVSQYLNGRFLQWAVVAAYGDNLESVADEMAMSAGWSELQRQQLSQLGALLNYNAYGETVEDLHFAPHELYRALHKFDSPYDFIDSAKQYQILAHAYEGDLERMGNLTAGWKSATGDIYLLPNESWARRVSGMLANRIAAADRDKAFAVLVPRRDGKLVVSVRSPAPETHSAQIFCAKFGGGGRRLAAGINDLDPAQIEGFVGQFYSFFGGEGQAT